MSNYKNIISKHALKIKEIDNAENKENSESEKKYSWFFLEEDKPEEEDLRWLFHPKSEA